jgi:ABC-type nitrate/sulfonate/bicarbonate transport system substrate-binding protein
MAEGHAMTRRTNGTTWLALAVLTLAGLLWAGSAAAQATKVRLQLKWVTQAQFAGYYAAKAQGFYKAENLDVTIIPGGPDIVPEQVVAGGGAEFGIDWLPSLLSSREQGVPLINIGQIFGYSGMRELAFKTSGIKTPADLKGRKVAVWFGGNEFALLATLAKYKLDPQKDLTLVQQPFDMNLLLQKQVDAWSSSTSTPRARPCSRTGSSPAPTGSAPARTRRRPPASSAPLSRAGSSAGTRPPPAWTWS